MKLRNGFVSNSSSSSFIVAFPKVPSCANDVRKMVFGNSMEKFKHPYAEKTAFTLNVVVKKLYKEMKDQEKMSDEVVIDHIKSGSFAGEPKYNFDYRRQEKDDVKYHIKCAIAKKNGTVYKTKDEIYQEKYSMRRAAAAKVLLSKFKSKCIPTDRIYHFNFSDNDSMLDSALEHGNVFNKLKHMVISQH